MMNPPLQPPTYEVGYGKPPVASQFTSGRSGNPKGRPKGSKSLRDHLDRELNKRVAVTVDGRQVRLTKGEVVAKQLVDKAMRGDARSIEKLFKTAGGVSAIAPASAPQDEEHDVSEVELQAMLAAFMGRQIADAPRNIDGSADDEHP